MDRDWNPFHVSLKKQFLVGWDGKRTCWNPLETIRKSVIGIGKKTVGKLPAALKVFINESRRGGGHQNMTHHEGLAKQTQLLCFLCKGLFERRNLFCFLVLNTFWILSLAEGHPYGLFLVLVLGLEARLGSKNLMFGRGILFWGNCF